MKFLKETIKLIKNNEEGVRNQTLWNNIGCHIEGDISHYCKGVLVKKATYHEKTLKNKLNTSMMNLKNKINLFNTNEPLEENRINYSVNNFVNISKWYFYSTISKILIKTLKYYIQPIIHICLGV
ncbi:hypothetical protein [Spiroplasma endosymbiont of Seladonia tumulorum]|uniref:hypothetical protein n=1 Tax=Spiroplasma endosymbiont of Seladonia tumulorum TaxID=3066321 RepID=UPI0030CFD747